MSLGRRRFLLQCTAASAAILGASARARGYGYDGELGHPVDPPPTLRFDKLSFETTPLNGQPSTAIVGVPTNLEKDQRVPLVVLLPGGHSNWQPHDAGCWAWWSEYGLGDCEAALHRGNLNEKDFQGLVRPEELARFNENLAKTPYQGVIVAAAWCLTRDYTLDKNGAMNSAWLRQLVERIRQQYPVIPTREATGIGGMSSGALWALWCGADCEDLFGMINATQPYTRELVQPLRRKIVARKGNQRLRVVGALDDRLRIPTHELLDALRADGVAFETYEYLGKHDQRFAAGPGGIDALFTFDRALRGQREDGTDLVPKPKTMTAPLPDVQGFVQGDVAFGSITRGYDARSLRSSIALGTSIACGTAAAALATVRGIRKLRSVNTVGDDGAPVTSRRAP